MVEFYRINRQGFCNEMNTYLRLIQPELESLTGEKFEDLFDEMWYYYDTSILSNLPYIGGNEASGTNTLVSAFYYVAMGEILKDFDFSMDQIGELMTLSYERKFAATSKMGVKLMHTLFTNPRGLTRRYLKKDAENQKLAQKYPDGFITKTQIPPEAGYDFSYRNLKCPLADFAKRFGYEEYMPYICNLELVMYGIIGAPFFREHTLMEDEYCDFKLKKGAEPLEYWPPVFKQDNPYK